MKKAILIFLIAVSLFGCEKQKTNQESKQSENEFKQWVDNMANEDVSLLSIKYNIPEETLKKIIGEYEGMVHGYNFRNLFSEEKSETDKFDPSKALSVQEAIKRLSSQYQIQENILANILIDKKSMNGCSND